VKDSSLQFLGLIQRSNGFVYGFKLMNQIRKNKVYCVILSSKASLRTQKQIKDKCAFYHIPVLEVNQEDVLHIIGEAYVALGITSQRMAKKIVKDEMR